MMRILIVDDNDDVRFLIEHTLAVADFEVTGAPGGRVALERLGAEDDFGFVILDVQMPDMDGWETLRAIRQDPRASRIPVVMCTVKGSPEDLIHGWELGCDGYIRKPFDIDDLSEQVRTVLARSEGERIEARAAGLAQARTLLEERV